MKLSGSRKISGCGGSFCPAPFHPHIVQYGTFRSSCAPVPCHIRVQFRRNQPMRFFQAFCNDLPQLPAQRVKLRRHFLLFSTPLYLLVPVYETVKGVEKKSYPEPDAGMLIYASFRTFGGTDPATPRPARQTPPPFLQTLQRTFRSCSSALRTSFDAAHPALQKLRVEWSGTKAFVDVGFDIQNGGLASIFLMYGTPRMKKDTKLYNDIYGKKTRDEIRALQEEIFRKKMDGIMGRG